jgi:transcriptional regulator with XRE-family HTH domain
VQERSIYQTFGRAVAERRTGRMTQLELARAIGISRASLANIERGEQRVYLHHVLALADVLGSDLLDLLPRRQFQPLPKAKVSVSGDRLNRAQERRVKELVSAITQSARK